MNFLVLALKYLPLVVQAVLAIENVFEGQAARGATKKALVIDSVKQIGVIAGASGDDSLKVIGTLIDSVVNTFNTLGWAK